MPGRTTGQVESMASYDVIFLGYPNWWGTMPMPVYTFLEEYDFSGKTLHRSARTREAAWGGVSRISEKCARSQRSLTALPSGAAT